MSQLTDYLLGQTLQTLQSLRSDHAETADTLEKMDEKLSEVLSWQRRLMLAILLWGGSAGISLSSDQLADLVVALLKR